MKYISRFFTMLIALFGIVVFFACGEKPPETFLISGYVIEDGKGVKDVVLSSDVGNVTTDENGFFVFSDITNGLTIEAQKDGYTFEKISQTFFGETTDALFVAHKFYNITGKVTSNGVGISDVKVTANALKSGYTVTNKDGDFILYNVAGEAIISAEKDGYVFFDKTCNYSTSQNITITATTNCDIKIDYVGTATNYSSETIILVDEKEISMPNATLALNNLTLGTKIKLYNANVNFEPSEVVICKENQSITFVGEKLYSINGYVKSGQIPLSNALISVGDLTTYSNNEGYFAFESITGENIVYCDINGFEFNNIVCNELNNVIEFQGTTSICGTITNNDLGYKNVEIYCGDNVTFPNEEGYFSLTNVKLGDIIKFECDEAKLSFDTFTITSANQNIKLQAQTYYNATIKVVDDYGNELSDVIVKINDDTFTTNEQGIVLVNSLYGTNTCYFELDGYHSPDNLQIIETETSYLVVLNEFYNSTIAIKTGDIILSNREIFINNQPYTTNENGEIYFSNLYGNSTMNIFCDGYNSLMLEINPKSKNKTISLSYDVSGYIKTNTIGIADVKIIYNDCFVYSDDNGYFSIQNLEGNVELTYNKEFYNFPAATMVASENNDILINATYKVFGYALSDNLGILGTEIILTSSDGNNNISIKTDNNGYYEFNNVSGKNILFYVNSDGLKLRPLSYNVSSAGQYDFMLNGFELGGYVYTNGVPVKDVKITAGGNITYTNEDGFYYFNLLKADCEIMAYKEGYSFTPSTISVSSEDNERRDINFDASYNIEGYIFWGNKPLEQVDVSIGDYNSKTNDLGYFNFSNLKGINYISLSKSGYVFEYQSVIEGYSNLEISAGAIITGIVTSGDMFIEDVDVILGSVTTKTNSQGVFLANLYQNDFEISCIKDGYNFDTSNFAITPGLSQTISATYSIIGTIKSADILINNASIKINNENTNYVSNENGEFIINNLLGTTMLSFEKTGYNITNITVNKPSEINLNATFSIFGYITFNNIGHKNVMVSSQGISTLTNEDGYYTIEGLTGTGSVLAIKNGYNFIGENNYYGYCQLDFDTHFSVSGFVKSGNQVLSDVSVKYGEYETLTDSQGYFYLQNITYSEEIEFSKTGYNAMMKSYYDYVENDTINLTYNSSIIFSGLAEYENITISTTDENEVINTYQCSNSKYVIENISGEILVSLSKTGYVFTPQLFAINTPTAISVNVEKSYSISGKVLVESTNVPVVGMKIYAGNESTVTDTNGNYTLNNLVGKTVIKGELSYNNCLTITTSSIQVSSAVIQNFNISLIDYTFFVFQKGYQLLNESNSSYVSINGTVSLTMGGTQQVRGIRKKDSNGIILTEKMNYGNTVAGVDPKVSLLTYYNSNNGETKYQQVKAVNSDYTANYGAFTDINQNEYRSIYGLYPYEHYAYIINKSTITNVSDIYKEGTNTTFTFNLNTSTAVSNYIKQMTALSGQTPSKFNYCNLTYTIGDDGYIRSLKIKEEYVINVVVSVTGTSEIVETFMITDKDTKLTDIDLNDIQKSLLFETKTSNINVLVTPNKKFRLKGEEN